jgi:hypothetical protein
MNEKHGKMDIDVRYEDADEPTYIPPGGRLPGEPVPLLDTAGFWIMGGAVAVLFFFLVVILFKH